MQQPAERASSELAFQQPVAPEHLVRHAGAVLLMLDCTRGVMQVAAMIRKRGGLAMTTVDGQILAVGGFNGSEFLKTVEAFDARKVRSLVYQAGRPI